MSDRDDDIENYWVKLLGRAQSILSGASSAQLKVILFETLEEFFDGSNVWQESVPFIVIPNTLDYKISVMHGRILRLWNVLNDRNVCQDAVMPEIGTVHFLYPFNDTYSMTAIVVKTVTDPLEIYPPCIPGWILPQYGRYLLEGLVGNTMQMPDETYSNPQLANFHLQRFRDGIAHARVAMMKANTVGAQAWAFPQSYRVYGQKGGVSTFNVHPAPR